MSVWGNNPRYIQGCIKNIKLCKEIYSDFIVKIFSDKIAHQELNSQDIDSTCMEFDTKFNSIKHPAFWRFLPAFYPNTDIFLSRDADSRVSLREKQCVDEWILSNKIFHNIKDHPRHFDFSIMAGMWGIRGPMDSFLLPKMCIYSQNLQYLSDQLYLKDVVWPRYMSNCYESYYTTVSWMNNFRDINFIGQGYDENDVPLYPIN